MKPGLVAGATPDRVMILLSDGRRRTLKAVALDLNPEEPHNVYTVAAQALYMLFLAGKVRRQKVRGRFAYWRDDVVAEVAAS